MCVCNRAGGLRGRIRVRHLTDAEVLRNSHQQRERAHTHTRSIKSHTPSHPTTAATALQLSTAMPHSRAARFVDPTSHRHRHPKNGSNFPRSLTHVHAESIMYRLIHFTHNSSPPHTRVHKLCNTDSAPSTPLQPPAHTQSLTHTHTLADIPDTSRSASTRVLAPIVCVTSSHAALHMPIHAPMRAPTPASVHRPPSVQRVYLETPFSG